MRRLSPAELTSIPNQDLKTTAVNQWNFVLQRQFGNDWLVSATYIGSESSHLWDSFQVNPALVLPCANGVVTSMQQPPATRTAAGCSR